MRSQRRLRFYNPVVTNGYTLKVSDAESVLYLTNAAAGTITVPTNATAGIGVGAMITVVCAGAQVTINPANNVSLFTIGADASGSIVIKKKNTVVLLFKIAENAWFALVPGVRDGQVGETDLATNAVTRDKIKNGEVIYGKLGPSAVHTAELDDGAVTPVKTTGLQKTIHVATATLNKDNWNSNTKSQSVTIVEGSGASAVYIESGSNFVAAPNNAIGWAAAADCMLFPPAAGTHTLTFTCDTIPTENIPITVYFWEA